MAVRLRMFIAKARDFSTKARNFAAVLIRSSPLSAFFLLLFLTVFISGFFVSYRRTERSSMEPTFTVATILVCTKSANPDDIHHGDCVVADVSDYEEGLVVIKRIVGTPGDTLQITDGKLFVNGEEVNDGFPPMEDAGIAAEMVTLGDDEYFLLGDNRNVSVDSRMFGPVNARNITNIVIFHIF